MKLTSHVLRSRSHGPLHMVEYLDLSNLGLASLEHFHPCPKLQTLILRGNRLQDVSGLNSCSQLWNLDLSNNQIQSLEGISQFLAFGSLGLANNNLQWQDLIHLRHMHILCLSLHGNFLLEKDPYYRIHVIDCLPSVWMLDGRIITSAERIQVKQFFQDSALTERPVRRKLKKGGFVPSSRKNIDISGIFGSKTVDLMKTFPKNAVWNQETDWMRFHYLVQTVQEDFTLVSQYTFRDPENVFEKRIILADMFNERPNRRLKCNLILLLLVASLEFVLPARLVKDTLENGMLQKIGSVHTMDLFLLPKAMRCKVASLLFGALKMDKDGNEDGGLPTKVYLSLYQLVLELTRWSETINFKEELKPSKLKSQFQECRHFLAREVLQMMCFVPNFSDYLGKDLGVMNLVKIATTDTDIIDKLAHVSESDGNEVLRKNVSEEIIRFLMTKVQEELTDVSTTSFNMSPCDKILTKSGALPMKGENTALNKAEYLLKGVTSPDMDSPVILQHKTSAKVFTRFPHLGDRLLLGPQTLGKIISLPQPSLALVIMDAVPVPSGGVEHKLKDTDDHYTYINMKQLEWDSQQCMWKPCGTVGDNASTKFANRFTLQTVDDFAKETGKVTANEEDIHPSDPPETSRSLVPLIFSSHSQQGFKTVALAHTFKSPRPMSSVFMPKKQFSPRLNRPTKSAGSRHLFSNSTSASGTAWVLRLFGSNNDNDSCADSSRLEETTHSLQLKFKSKVDLKEAEDKDQQETVNNLLVHKTSTNKSLSPSLQSDKKFDAIKELQSSDHNITDTSEEASNSLTLTTEIDNTGDKTDLSQGTNSSRDSDSNSQLTKSGFSPENSNSQMMDAGFSPEIRDSGSNSQMVEASFSPENTDSDSNSKMVEAGFSSQNRDSDSNNKMVEVSFSPENRVSGSNSQVMEVGFSPENRERDSGSNSETVEAEFSPENRASDKNSQIMEAGFSHRNRGRESDRNSKFVEAGFSLGRSASAGTERLVGATDTGHFSNLEHYSSAGHSRPMSASGQMHAYKNVIGGPETNFFLTEFEQQRINVWKYSTRPNSHTKALQTPPPPQRPSSPMNQDEESDDVRRERMSISQGSTSIPVPRSSPQPGPRSSQYLGSRIPQPGHRSSPTMSIRLKPPSHWVAPDMDSFRSMGLRIAYANQWLAGGRDLFWEEQRKRPKSGHIPGWKEGLPQNMLKPRPRSAFPRTNQQLLKTTKYTMPSPNPRPASSHLRELVNFNNFCAQPSRHLKKQYSLYDEDPLPGLIHNDIASPLIVTSCGQVPADGRRCIYEQYQDHWDCESNYNPVCTTPSIIH